MEKELYLIWWWNSYIGLWRRWIFPKVNQILSRGNVPALIILNFENFINKEVKVLSAPISLCLSITDRCNLNCRHCLAAGVEEELDTEEMIKIIRKIGNVKVFSVGIFGGEPLVRKDIWRFIEELKKFPISLSLNTNGTLITPHTAKRLKEFGVKDIVLSLDGSEEKIVKKIFVVKVFLIKQ
ncbi:MAG: radical SAM protein [candidate division WOR-3 bacterium]